MCELTEEMEARGEQLPGAGAIAAIIFPADAPDWQVRAAEIAENYCRKELAADERAAHALLYAAELKESGRCATVEEARAAAGRKGAAATNKTGKPPAGGLPPEKPTVTQATAAGLGISTNAVEKRVKAAAKAAGVDAVSIERDTPEKLREVGNIALEQAKRKPRKKTTARPLDIDAIPDATEEIERVIKRVIYVLPSREQQELLLAIETLVAWFRNDLCRLK